jgi:predicted DNA-binding mobile mystery protein A
VKRPTPPRGWLKLIREALGRTERQQAQRLGIAGATLHKSEQSEADDRITLGQLRKLADGLDCELVHALVPRRPLTDVVQERARAIAMEEVGGEAHTMGLEDQRPGTYGSGTCSATHAGGSTTARSLATKSRHAFTATWSGFTLFPMAMAGIHA